MSFKSRKKDIPDKDIGKILESFLDDSDDTSDEDDQQSAGSSIKENNKAQQHKVEYKIDKKAESKKKQESNPTVSPILIKRVIITEVAIPPIVPLKPFVVKREKKSKNTRPPLRSISRDVSDSKDEKLVIPLSPTKSPAKFAETPRKLSKSPAKYIVKSSEAPKETISERLESPKSKGQLEYNQESPSILSQNVELTSSIDGLRINSGTRRSRRNTPSTYRKRAANAEAKLTDCDVASPFHKLGIRDAKSPDSNEGVTPRKRPKKTRKSKNHDKDVEDSSDSDLAVPLENTRERRSVRPPIRYGTPLKDSITSTPSRSCKSPGIRRSSRKLYTPRSSLAAELSSPVRSAKKKLDLTNSPRSAKVGRGALSPSLPERTRGSIKMMTPSSLDLIRTKLHASSLPKCLPCREKEFNNIKSFIERKIDDEAGGCMYISGVPGTGKTASVHSVIRHLLEQARKGNIPNFDFIEINGLRLTQPKEAYVRIWQALTDKKISAAEALLSLEKKFLKHNKRSTVLLVDELDYLCNRRQDVIYNILDWSTQRHSKLVVLTIANTMDLPERTLKGKVTSRMGLTRLVFQPYSFKQLETIVLDRIAGSSTFHADAVQLAVRKVAAVSGDARRALDICRRATDIAENDGREMVTVGDVEETLTKIFRGSRVMTIKRCSKMAQFVLRALRDEILRTGVEESSVRAIYPQIVAICAFEGMKEPTSKDVLVISSQLNDSGLIVAEKGRKDLSRKLSLNVSCDDVHFALNV